MWINSEFSSPSWALDFPDLVPGMNLLNKSNNMCAVKYFNNHGNYNSCNI